VLRSTIQLLIVGLCLAPPALLAAEPADQEAIHNELRALRQGLIEAYNAGDLDRLLSFCDKNVVVTWQNGEVSVGPEGIRSYYQKMMEGPDRVVAKLAANPEADDLSVIYGDTTATSRGKMNDHYDLANGMSFDMNSRWSATAVKVDGRWLVASLHASVNAFDNSILRLAVRRTMLWTGGIALVVGLAIGVIATRLLWKPKPSV
jgi:ketosteroid isomerase-like protein